MDPFARQLRRLDVAMQPIVDLATREVVGFEALLRDDRSTPTELLARADALGRTAELDWRARARAVEAALAAGFPRQLRLFLNVEPSVAHEQPPAALRPLLTAAVERLEIVLEFTERDLLSAPSAMVAAAVRSRRLGRTIALDDVGAEPAALPLLGLLAPDVVKLDRRLVQDPIGAEAAQALSAVRDHVERSGAVVLAEGIETDDHLIAARELGATYGQGEMFGGAGPLRAPLPVPTRPLPQPTPVEEPVADDLLDLLARRRYVRIEAPELVEARLAQFHEIALARPAPMLAIEASSGPTGAQRLRRLRRYGALGGPAWLLAPRTPPTDDRLQHARLAPGALGAGQWASIVLGPFSCLAVVGRPGPDGDVAHVTSADRDLVALAARWVLERVEGSRLDVDPELVAAARRRRAPARR